MLNPELQRLSEELKEELAPAGSEEALALFFAAIHDGDLRYVAPWHRWTLWTGKLWKHDDTLEAFDKARRVCRAAANAANKKGSVIASRSTIRAVEGLAMADRRLAATTDQWDCDPWLLNTPDGIVDLRNGQCLPHDHTYYMSKMTAVPADPDCATPHWLAFLDKVTVHNAELGAFLQRMSGYALTGITREHALFFLYGVGSNGKTTFLNAITGALGDYCRSAPIETFTASKSDRHPTDLAGLQGARLVTAVETEEGRNWAESKIKTLTGGEKISARFMKCDFFEYTPQFKLVIAGNHKPGLRSVDEAIRRRLHLIPFTVTIPKAERDQELSHKLKAEGPGILQWMVDGCLQWQQHGLAPPSVVTEATAAYLAAEDAITAWIEECADIDPNAWEPRTSLWISWSTWATAAGEFAGNQKRFYERLNNRNGMEAVRHRDGRGFRGLRLKPVNSSTW